MRSRLHLTCAVTLLTAVAAVSCKQGGDNADDVGTSDTEAALALAEGLVFEGGDPRDGDIPKTTAPEVTLVTPSGTSDVLIAPGSSDVLLPFTFDNPNEAGDPVELTLLQFGGVDEHVAILRADSGGQGDMIVNKFSVKDDVCDELCDREYDLTLFETVGLKKGKIGKHHSRKLTLDCRKHGSAKKCGKQSGGGDGNTSVSDAGDSARDASVASDEAIASAFVMALGSEPAEWQRCACVDTADATCDEAPPASELDARTACILSAAAGEATNREWIECATQWLVDARQCYDDAGCDAAAAALCVPSEHKKDGGTGNMGGPPPEVVEKCGAPDEAFITAADGCMSDDMSPDSDASVGPSPVDCSAIPTACLDATMTYCECCPGACGAVDMCTQALMIQEQCAADPTCMGDCSVWVIGDCAMFQAMDMCPAAP